MGFEKFWRGYDWVARADLAVGWLFDWRKWLWSFVPGGAAMTFLWAAIEGRSPLDVWIAAVIVMAALAVFVYFLIAILEKIKAPRAAIATAESRAVPDEFADNIPDVRVADDMVAWGLFAAPHHDKLLPLLERGKIEAWGRLGNGGPPLALIPATQWTTHYLDFRPALGDGSINQTFFRPRSRPYESTYYDVHLNRSQLKKAWPDLWDSIPLLEAATRAYEQTRDKIVSGAAEAFEHSPDDVLIWYCDAMARPRKGTTLVTLWGVRPPSRKFEQIYMQALNNYAFAVENGAVVLKPSTGSGQYEKIVADENQVAAAIKEIAEWGG